MDGNKESRHKNKADEIERNMPIYGDSSVYLGRFLFPLPQTQFIFELTHTTLSVKTWWHFWHFCFMLCCIPVIHSKTQDECMGILDVLLSFLP